jgi:tetratricopeptide (TPR) repeat protein
MLIPRKPEKTDMSVKTKKVLLIGWDAADWKIINPLIEAGEMPALEGLIKEGVMGNISTLEPSFSPMLWTSIATGKRAYDHGILGFVEPSSSGTKIRPVSSLSRKVKAVWNILMQEGKKVHSVGWWPSHPAEPLNGINISNAYQKATEDYGKAWPMDKGTVHPVERSELFASLRLHPAELTGAHIFPFIPDATKIDQEVDKGLNSFARILAETSTINSAGTWILENEEWDFMSIYFDGIDHFCHGFIHFHPPKMKGMPEDMFQIYKSVINGAYKFHDMMLERQLQLAGPDATVILVSDHGFHSDHLRPRYLTDEPAAPAQQHRKYGIICMKGPHIKKNEKIYGTTLLDITPTILSLFGLPIGKDMEGRPLVQAFEGSVKVKITESWEKLEGNSGMHPYDRLEDPYEASEEIARLVELGYIEAPGKDNEETVKKTITESRYNLARAYIGGGKYREAIPILEEIYSLQKDQSRYALWLANCYYSLDEFDRCREIIEDFEKHQQAALEKQKEKLVEKKDRTGLSKDDLDKIDQEESRDKIRLLNTRNDLMSLALMKANILMKENKVKEALNAYGKLETAFPNSKILQLNIGNAYINLKNWDRARSTFQKAAEIDPDDSTAHHGLAVCHLRTGNYYEAIEEAMNSISLTYNFPFAHYHLGEALFNIGEIERAAEAFEICLVLNPGIGRARNWLIKIYDENLDLKEKAEVHKKFFTTRASSPTKSADTNQKAIADEEDSAGKTGDLRNPIIVVSGLPRSGTSMMMQMLEEGGIEIYTDNKRQADESNPKGYYEHDAVKSLARNKRWLGSSRNKAIKIIANLLFHLPAKYNYKIIFMMRHIDEVLNSQQQMLIRKGSKAARNYPTVLVNAYKKTLIKTRKWAKVRHNVRVIYVNYTDVINDTGNEARRIADFLDMGLDPDKMATVVDKKLYRARMDQNTS